MRRELLLLRLHELLKALGVGCLEGRVGLVDDQLVGVGDDLLQQLDRLVGTGLNLVGYSVDEGMGISISVPLS